MKPVTRCSWILTIVGDSPGAFTWEKMVRAPGGHKKVRLLEISKRKAWYVCDSGSWEGPHTQKGSPRSRLWEWELPELGCWCETQWCDVICCAFGCRSACKTLTVNSDSLSHFLTQAEKLPRELCFCEDEDGQKESEHESVHGNVSEVLEGHVLENREIGFHGLNRYKKCGREGFG